MDANNNIKTDPWVHKWWICVYFFLALPEIVRQAKMQDQLRDSQSGNLNAPSAGRSATKHAYHAIGPYYGTCIALGMWKICDIWAQAVHKIYEALH